MFWINFHSFIYNSVKRKRLFSQNKLSHHRQYKSDLLLKIWNKTNTNVNSGGRFNQHVWHCVNSTNHHYRHRHRRRHQARHCRCPTGLGRRRKCSCHTRHQLRHRRCQVGCSWKCKGSCPGNAKHNYVHLSFFSLSLRYWTGSGLQFQNYTVYFISLSVFYNIKYIYTNASTTQMF